MTNSDNIYQRTEDEQRRWMAMSPQGRRSARSQWKHILEGSCSSWYSYRPAAKTLAKAEQYYWEDDRRYTESNKQLWIQWKLQSINQRKADEEQWRDYGGKKPRHLRKRWKSRKRIGSDTRRYNAAGKMIGNNHRYKGGDYTSVDYYRERRAGKLIIYYYMLGLELEDFQQHIEIPRCSYECPKPKLQY